MDNSAEPNKYGWRRIQGRTPSGQTGPNGDHTTELLNKDGMYELSAICQK